MKPSVDTVIEDLTDQVQPAVEAVVDDLKENVSVKLNLRTSLKLNSFSAPVMVFHLQYRRFLLRDTILRYIIICKKQSMKNKRDQFICIYFTPYI